MRKLFCDAPVHILKAAKVKENSTVIEFPDSSVFILEDQLRFVNTEQSRGVVQTETMVYGSYLTVKCYQHTKLGAHHIFQLLALSVVYF